MLKRKVNNPLISVVIPSFNKGDYIEKTLNSIVNQEYKNFEIIIQDGGSTDGSVEIIKNFVIKYPNYIKWESKKDKGQVDAINKGLKKANGDILSYINADDLYAPNAFGNIVNAFHNNQNELWFAGKGSVIDKNDNQIAGFATKYKNLLFRLNSYILLLMVNYFMQPSVFLTKNTYQKYGPFYGTKNFVLEYDLWLKIGKIKMPVIIDEYLSYFRLSGDNISSVAYDSLLSSDYNILLKYTNNPIIKLLHKCHNYGRVLTTNTIIK